MDAAVIFQIVLDELHVVRAAGAVIGQQRLQIFLVDLAEYVLIFQCDDDLIDAQTGIGVQIFRQLAAQLEGQDLVGQAYNAALTEQDVVGGYKDGTYEGAGMGFGGEITVSGATFSSTGLIDAAVDALGKAAAG